MQKRTIKYFIQALRKYPGRSIGLIFNPMLTVLIGTFLGPYIISILLGQIQNGSISSVQHSSGLLLAYFLTQIYGEVVGWRINLFMAWTLETAAQRDLYNKIFSKLTNESIDFHANRFGGSLVSQSNKFVGAFERFCDTIIFQFIPSITSIVAAVVILSFIFWQYALVLLVVSVIFIVVVMMGSRSMAILNTTESQASTKLTGRLADAMTNIMAIKSHGSEATELSGYNKLTRDWRNKSLASMRGFLKISTVYSGLIAVLNTVALAMAMWASSNHTIAIAVVYLSVTYTMNVARQLWEMNSIMRNYNRIMGDAHDMTEILGLSPTIADSSNAAVLAPRRGKIEFKNVTFAHAGNEPLFDGLDLSIKPGEKIGLVGQSGSGKTTLSKLLLRFMDIQDGSILIDDQDITAVTQQSLRQAVAYVPQEPLLFHRTLAENIEYGEPGSDAATIKGVSKMAHAHEFIDKLEHGYDTLVGERGVKLSGGQRQRVAIARAMIKNARILVLDEATSALDSESEALIQDALWTLMEGRTAIVIAHRLSTIQRMDRIIVLHDGKIVEQGSHKELIYKNGSYAELWKRQSGGFLDD